MNIRQRFLTLYRRIVSSSFLKSVLTLSSGVMIAQGINFLGMPVVGRVYNPAAIGDYTVITANANVIMSVACLGMMTAFMLPERNEEARGLTRLVTFSTLIITTLSILGLWFCSGFYRIFHTEDAPYTLSLIVLWLYIVFYTVNNIGYAYVNRQKLYRVMFWNPILSAGINVNCSIFFGLLDWGFLGYTAAHILALAATSLHLFHHANPYKKISDPSLHCLPLLKSYRRFLIYQMPSNLIANVGQQLPVQMMETLYSSSDLGLYSMARKILSLPSLLLSTPINRVYYQEASQRYNRGENIGAFSFGILQTNIKLALGPILLLILFGESLFSVFLGEQWRQAGTFAAVLGLYQLMLFCRDCLSGAPTIIRQNRINLYDAVVSLILNAVFFWAAWRYIGRPLTILALLSAADTVRILVFQGIFLKLSGFKVSVYLSFVLRCVFLPVGLVWGLRLVVNSLFA